MQLKRILKSTSLVGTLILSVSLLTNPAEARRYRYPRPVPVPAPAPAPTPVPAPIPAPVPSTSQTQALQLSNPTLSAQPGQSFSFITRFNAVPMDKNYVVFVHFVNSAGGVASFGGDYSPTPVTTQWSGLITANRTVTVPSSLPAGKYTVRIGLYENVAPYTNRVKLAVGPGVTEDGETRYIVGSLTVGSTSPSPAPAPAPAPAPVPAPTPAPAPTPSYTLTISSPVSGATVSGSILVKGTGPGFQNVEVLTSNGSLLARTTPDSSGNFQASVDTTKLANGSQTVTIDAWDSPAGQNFTHSDEKKITLNVQNAGSVPAPSPSPSPAPAPQPSAQLRIMFIGNSLTGVDNMPAEFKHLANSKGFSPYVEEYIAYGQGLDYQLGRQDIKDALSSKKWDYVVLQEFSDRPLTDPNSFRQSVIQFDQLIKANGAKTVLFENWSYKGESTTSQLNSIYSDVAGQVGASIAPLAKAWNYVVTNSGINLYIDEKHPTPIASYMGACVFYKLFYGQSPVGLTHEGSQQDTPDVFGGPVPSQPFINLDSTDGSSNVNLVQKAAGMY